jgi:hypothetical protein
MKKRIAPYIIIVLAAIILALLPILQYLDMGADFSKWENWYSIDHPGKRPSFDGSHLPPMLEKEELLFKLLVIPPSWAWERLGGPRTHFAAPYLHPKDSCECAATFPPFVLYAEHLKIAWPFWFIMGLVLYEAASFARRVKKKSLA